MCIGLITASAGKVSFAATTPASQGAAVWKTEPEDTRAWPREPFRKLEGPKAAASPLQGVPGMTNSIVLQGIMKIDRHFYAVINGRTVRTGDHIDEWTIAGITRHRVTLRSDKEQQIYDIYQGRINRGTK